MMDLMQAAKDALQRLDETLTSATVVARSEDVAHIQSRSTGNPFLFLFFFFFSWESFLWSYSLLLLLSFCLLTDDVIIRASPSFDDVTNYPFFPFLHVWWRNHYITPELTSSSIDLTITRFIFYLGITAEIMKLLREGKRHSPDFYRALSLLIVALYNASKVTKERRFKKCKEV